MAALNVGRSTTLLASLQNDADWRVRTAAATALGQHGDATQRQKALSVAWQRVAAAAEALSSPDLHPLMALLDAANQRPEPGMSKGLRQLGGDLASAFASAKSPVQRTALAHLKCLVALALDRTQERAAEVQRCVDLSESPSIPAWEIRRMTARAWSGIQPSPSRRRASAALERRR